MYKLKLGVVMGEVSGDLLGASLVQALKPYCSSLAVEGILGSKTLQMLASLEAAGSGTLNTSLETPLSSPSSLYPMDRLSIIGLVEALRRIPELFWIRHQLIQHFFKNPPQLFIGIDAPEFNLGLELKLREKLKAHSKTSIVQYVSPSVWAWRKGRVHTIKKAVDLMLVLFPFEAKFYEEQGIPVCFTGHPMADQVPLQIDTDSAKRVLGFSNSTRIIALLPGSRNKELGYMAGDFLRVAQWCYKKLGNPEDLAFVVPLVNDQHVQWFSNLHQAVAPELPIKIVLNDSRTALAACDVALVKSGTATLEVMFHKKPMVATYKMNPLTFQIARRLVKIPYLTLPNLLAEEQLFPEFLQDEVTPERVGPALLKGLEGGVEVSYLQTRFMELHQILRCGASQRAAKAIMDRVS